MAKQSAPAGPAFWLMKTEPDCFSIDDLAKKKNQTTFWDGVRNYQARNFMRDDMRVGDKVLVYHSGGNPPGIAGLATVAKAAYPDFTALDPKHDHYDPKSTPENPIWYMVDIRLERKFPRELGLDELRAITGLKSMELLRRGSRLSVQPVKQGEFEIILKLADQPGASKPPAARSTARSNAKPAKAARRSAV